MYNVIIVEDDAIVRAYLRSLLDWNVLGLNISGEFVNGFDAKEYIDREQVDIVITDISMPVLNGIELIKHIKSSGKIIKIIVLSCYNDYDFLREALKCGVSDYILKQYLTKEMLLNLLDKTIQELGREITISKQYNDDAIKSTLLKNIISRIIINEEEAIEYFSEIGYIFNNSKYFVVVIKLDDYAGLIEKSDKSLMKNYKTQALEIIENSMKNELDGLMGLTRENEFTLLLSFHADQDLSRVIEKIDGLIRNISHGVKSELDFTVSIGVSNICSSLSQIPEAYKRTLSVIKGHMLFHKGKLVFLKDQKSRQSYTLSHEEEKNLLSAIIEGNSRLAIMTIERCLDKLELLSENVDSLESYILDLVNILTRIAMKCEIVTKTLFGDEKLPYEEFEEKCNIDEIKNWFFAIINRIILLNSERNNSHRTEVMKAVEYIENHYSEEISLRDVSSYVNISPNHFSMVFKKEIGVGFAEYLLNFRLERAKELLKKKDIKIYEAAFKVGFNNNQYFNRVFKDKYGLTPMSYKKESV